MVCWHFPIVKGQQLWFWYVGKHIPNQSTLNFEETRRSWYNNWSSPDAAPSEQRPGRKLDNTMSTGTATSNDWRWEYGITTERPANLHKLNICTLPKGRCSPWLEPLIGPLIVSGSKLDITVLSRICPRNQWRWACRVHSGRRTL